jgi:hypothetical protein
MSLPDVPFQYSPVPDVARFISRPTVTPFAPQLEHEASQVNDRLVHDVAREASRQLEDTMETVKNTGLPDPGIELSPLVLGFTRRREDEVEISSISSRIHWRKIVDFEVRVIGTFDVRVQGSKQGRIVVRAARFIASKESTEYSASLLAMMANSAAQLGHSDGIRKDQEEEDYRERLHTAIAVPDTKTFLLDRRDVRQTWEEKRVEMFGIFWAGNNAARKNIAYLVTLIGCQIQDYPDIYPTVGFLVTIKLRAVDR